MEGEYITLVHNRITEQSDGFLEQETDDEQNDDAGSKAAYRKDACGDSINPFFHILLKLVGYGLAGDES